MTLSPAPPEEDPLATAIESSSSKNNTHGEAALALSKTSLTFDSLSPKYFVSSYGPLIEMKFALHSFATALANRVFPHPGGP